VLHGDAMGSAEPSGRESTHFVHEIAEARARWPEFEVAKETFEDYLGEHPLTQPSHVADLYLACACGLGDARALEVFERLFFDEIDAVAARLRDTGLAADEARQFMRERFFLGTPGAAPKITTYSGRGSLRHWVRIASMRAALNLTRGRGRETSNETELLRLPEVGDDPELGFMKRLYQKEFDAAVTDAFDSLSFRERNLLKYATVDQLSAEAIGSIYRVHRTTAKRWIEEASLALLDAIRKTMLKRLSVSRAELESILRLVQSRLELRLAERTAAEAN
jgi:RNA polymerase sigma-70 factor (ECF subfamily)